MAEHTEGWGRYVAAVARELAALGRPSVGFAGEVRATFRPGKGLSSSAALEVGVALALCAVADFELEPLELARPAGARSRGPSASRAGSSTRRASLLGQEDYAILIDTASPRAPRDPLPPGRARRHRLGVDA